MKNSKLFLAKIEGLCRFMLKDEKTLLRKSVKKDDQYILVIKTEADPESENRIGFIGTSDLRCVPYCPILE